VSEIFPNKAYSAVYYNASPSADTYYTGLNISAKGILNKVNFVSYGTAKGTVLQIKLTVDGAAYEFPLTTRDDSRSPANVSGAGVQYVGPLYFRTSLKVECKQTTGSMSTIEIVTDYSLV
jgi:hypothetical protein